MAQLTPDNLEEFVEDAQRFLNRGSVDVFTQGAWYGRYRVTVKVAQQGEILVAQFDLEGATIYIAAFPIDSPYKNFYEITNTRLTAQRQAADGTMDEVIFTLE